MSAIRIGHGFDVHALASGDGLILGGVSIPFHKSLIAHSDGDVLIHALCDALLGAMGRGDIGRLFPDSNDENRNRDSREFLREVKNLLDQDHCSIGNVDITIVAQAPKMSPHYEAMQAIISGDLDCEAAQINIKATTTEKLGFIGREQGIAVHVVVLLQASAA